MFFTNVDRVFEEAETKKTRIERIREMDVDDLAWVLMEFRIDAFAKSKGDECALPDTKAKIAEWLQEVTGGVIDG